MTQDTHDVIVIGGSYAGMAAALQLVRARRSVIVVDAGQRRNRTTTASHGFLCQDGKSPDAIANQARQQLLAYPTLTWIQDEVTTTAAKQGSFSVSLRTGRELVARRLILATGVVDELPDLPGLQERWGRSVHACPYCDGYELNQGEIGILATNGLWYHYAMLVSDWGQVTVLLNGVAGPDSTQQAALEKRGIIIEETLVAGVDDTCTVHLQDGRRFTPSGLFVMPRTRFSIPIVDQLGCTTKDGPIGSYLHVDDQKETNIPGVFACGDVARAAATVAFAVSDGVAAGIAVHQSLIFRE